MKDSNRIPAGEAGQFQRWVLPEVGEPACLLPSAGESVQEVPSRDPEPEPAPAAASLTAAELEALREAAMEEGRQEGLERGQQEGWQAGHEQGRQAGLEAAREEVQALQQRLAGLCGQLLQPLAEQRAALQEAVTGLVVELTKAVLEREPVTPADRMIAAAEQALAALPAGAEGLSLHLHPADLAELEASGLAPAEWRLVADDQLQPGGLTVHTRHSVVDFSRETRLKQLLAAMLEEPATEWDEPGEDSDE